MKTIVFENYDISKIRMCLLLSCVIVVYLLFYRPLSAKEIAFAGLSRNQPKKLCFIDALEKGRGIAAEENVKAGDFVCEYKYNISYPLKEKKRHDEEYAINEEGCFIMEVQLPADQGWLCLDATRNYESWGRYINHSAKPNLKKHAPLFVDGKWRVAFLALRDILKGEELSYDYGKQPNPPSWMRRKVNILICNKLIGQNAS